MAGEVTHRWGSTIRVNVAALPAQADRVDYTAQLTAVEPFALQGARCHLSGLRALQTLAGSTSVSSSSVRPAWPDAISKRVSTAGCHGERNPWGGGVAKCRSRMIATSSQATAEIYSAQKSSLCEGDGEDEQAGQIQWTYQGDGHDLLSRRPNHHCWCRRRPKTGSPRRG